MGVLVFIAITIVSSYAGWILIKAGARSSEPPQQDVPVARIANPSATEQVYAKVSTHAPRVANGVARALLILLGVGLLIAPWILGLLMMAIGSLATV